MSRFIREPQPETADCGSCLGSGRRPGSKTIIVLDAIGRPLEVECHDRSIHEDCAPCAGSGQVPLPEPDGSWWRDSDGCPVG